MSKSAEPDRLPAGLTSPTNGSLQRLLHIAVQSGWDEIAHDIREEFQLRSYRRQWVGRQEGQGGE